MSISLTSFVRMRYWEKVEVGASRSNSSFSYRKVEFLVQARLHCVEALWSSCYWCHDSFNNWPCGPLFSGRVPQKLSYPLQKGMSFVFWPQLAVSGYLVVVLFLQYLVNGHWELLNLLFLADSAGMADSMCTLYSMQRTWWAKWTWGTGWTNCPSSTHLTFLVV